MERIDLNANNLDSDAISVKAIDADAALTGTIQIDYGNFLFSADYSREGPDLIITGQDGRGLVLTDYFSNNDTADLRSPEGAILRGEVVARLAGPENPGAYAQQGAIDGAETIGQVEKLEGTATVQRADGTTETLQVGSKIFQNDVVQTGDNSSLSLTFVDGTIFTLSSASRMILDELIYDPDGDSNSAVFNLVEGTFVFIAGQVAKTGDMEVKTPVATMGIRGTTVLVEIETINGVATVEVSLNVDPDGGIGSFTISDLDGNPIADVVEVASKWIVLPTSISQEPRTPADIEEARLQLIEAKEVYEVAQENFKKDGTFLKNDTVDGDGQNNEAPEETPEGTDGPGENSPGDQGGLNLNNSLDLVETLVAELLTEVLPIVVDVVTPDPVVPPPPPIVDPDTGTDPNPNPNVNLPPPDESDNSAPVIIFSNLGTLSVDEDGSTVITDVFEIVEASGSSANDLLTVTLTASSTITLAPGSGVTLLNQNDGIEEEMIAFEGTVSQVNAALDGLIYYPSDDHDVEGHLSISVSDEDNNTTTSELVIPITPSQDPPTANDDTLDRSENADIFAGNLLQNDTDPDTGDELTLISISHSGFPLTFGQVRALSGGGLIVFNDDGGYSLILGDNYNGLKDGESVTETFSYTISDDNGGTDAASFVLTITGQNDAPVIVDPSNPGSDSTNPIAADPLSIIATQVVNIGEDYSATELIDISDFAVDPDDDNLTFSTIDSLPAGLTLNANGTITGVVAAGTSGDHSITISVFDGIETTTVNLNIFVTPPNVAPVAVDDDLPQHDGLSVSANTIIDGADLLANDTDANSDTLTITAVDGTSTNDATLTLNANGTITYNPNTSSNLEALDQGAILTDSFSYTIDDGQGGTDTAEVTVSVIGENDAPTVVGPISDISVDEDSSSTTTLPSNIFDDPDTNATLTYSAQRVVGGTPAALPAWITFTAATMIFAITGPGNADVGTHTIRVTATDEHGASTFTDFDLTVDNVNDAPEVDQGMDDQTLVANASANFSVPSDAFSDVDLGDSLTYTAFIQNGSSEDPLPSWLSFSNGTFSGNAAYSSGNFDVTVRATDGSGATAETTFSIGITPDIIGTSAADNLATNANDNHVTALAGDDVIFGSAGDDLIDGGDGEDTINYSFATQNLLINLNAQAASGAEIGSDQFISIENAVGGSGNDVITGDSGDNELYGNDGVDTLSGGDGLDQYFGGAGNDLFVGGTRGEFHDFDIANYSNAGAGVTGTLSGILGSTSSTVTGSASGTDTLQNIDAIFGSAFDDVLSADISFLGQHDEFHILEGGGGNDIIIGNGNTVVSFYDAKDGVVIDLSQRTSFSLNAGDTAMVGHDNFFTDNDSAPIINIRGSDFDDILRGSDNDREYLRGRAGDDFLDGRGGVRDTADYQDSPTGVTVNLITGIAQDGWGTTDTLINIERVRGSDFDDVLIGNSSHNLLRGRGGDDDLTGNGGSDFYVGGAGNDTFHGDASTTGFDRAAYWDATAGVEITLRDGPNSTTSKAVSRVLDDSNTGTDTLINIDGAAGSEFDDIFTVEASYVDMDGGKRTNFEGGAGDDIVNGNGEVTVQYWDALDGVTVNLQPGTILQPGTAFSTNANDTANIGTDTLVGIRQVTGSWHDDILTSDDSESLQYLEGLGGDDFIDGGTDGVGAAVYWGSYGSIYADMNVGPMSGQFYVNDGYGTIDTVTNINVIHGSEYNDTIITDNDGGMQVFGHGGNDTLTGGTGDDYLFGDDGNDILNGGDGADQIFAGDGHDTINAGAGNDYVNVGYNNDEGTNIIAGQGDDTYDFIDAGSNTWISFNYNDGSQISAGVTFNIDSTSTTATVDKPGAETDNFTNFQNMTYGSQWGGTQYDDFYNVTTDGVVFFILYGGEGEDTFDVDTSAGGGVRLSYRDFSGTGLGIDADLRALDLGNNAIIVDQYGDDDVIIAGSSVWEIQGTRHADEFHGSNLNESFIGRGSDNGVGFDLIDGGGGTDRVRYDRSGVSNVDVDMSDPNSLGYGLATGTWDGVAFEHHLVSIEHIRGSGGDDTLQADDNGMFLEGKDGGDFLQGGDGDDQLNPGSNTAWNSGGTSDSIFGSGGSDQIDFVGGTSDSFYSLNYGDGSVINGGIEFTVTGATALVKKYTTSGPEFDNYTNFDLASGLHISGTANDDIFTIDALSGAAWTRDNGFDTQWFQIEAGDGDDIFNVGSGYVRISYTTATIGISLDLTNIASANVSFGDGLTGTDTIIAGSIISEVRGSDFSDMLTGSAADDTFITRASNDLTNLDIVDGGDGFDRVRYDRPNVTSVNVDLSDTVGANVTGMWDGNIFNDQLISIEWVRGSGGDDQITGSAANERLDGRGGSDILDGGAGNDEIITGNANGGSDTVRANVGNDTIDVSSLTDGYFSLEYNNAAVITNGITANITATGGTIGKGALGTDTLIGLDSIDTDNHGFGLIGTAFDDTFTINQANDDWMQVRMGDGADTINVLGGYVKVDYSDAQSGIDADLAAGTVDDGFGNTDLLYGDIWEIGGSDFDDSFVGSNANESYSGRKGDDDADGGLGFDRIRFEHGGADSAVVDMAAGTAAVTYGATTYNQTFSNFEWVVGTTGADTIIGSANDDRIDGNGGNDTIDAGAGNDRIIIGNAFTSVDGGTGQDVLALSGDYNLNNIFGGVDGLETIDLVNATADNIELTQESVQFFSSETNDILTSNGATDIDDTDAILVLGNPNDSIILGSAGSGSGSWSEFSGRSFSLGDDYYDVYSFVDGSTILATIAIDDDVAVTIVVV